MSISLRHQKITVLFGGTSPEREISLISGRAVIKALETLGAQVQAMDVGTHFITEQ